MPSYSMRGGNRLGAMICNDNSHCQCPYTDNKQSSHALIGPTFAKACVKPTGWNREADERKCSSDKEGAEEKNYFWIAGIGNRR